MTTRALRVLLPALLLSASWSVAARAEQCMDVAQFNTFMGTASGPTSRVTLTFDVTGVNPGDFASSKGCLAELLDSRCVAGSTANLKVYGPYNPPNTSHPAGTLKFEFGNQCCAKQPCQAEGWASPNASATVFSNGGEKCAVKITLDPLHIAYHLDCGGGAIFDAIGDNVDGIVVDRIAILKRVDGGWAMPNASASAVKVCFDPPAIAPGVLTMDVPVLEDVTASISSPGVYPGFQELGVEANDSEIFLKFDLGAISGQIKKAKIYLHESDIASSNGDGGDAYLVPSSAWSEGSLTWGTRPSTSGASLARVSPISAFDWYSWDVSAAVQTPATYSFAIRPEPGDTNGAHFFSKEGSKPFAPYMHVEYVAGDGGLDSGAGDPRWDGGLVIDGGGRPPVGFGDPGLAESGNGCSCSVRAQRARGDTLALVVLAGICLRIIRRRR